MSALRPLGGLSQECEQVAAGEQEAVDARLAQGIRIGGLAGEIDRAGTGRLQRLGGGHGLGLVDGVGRAQAGETGTRRFEGLGQSAGIGETVIADRLDTARGEGIGGEGRGAL